MVGTKTVNRNHKRRWIFFLAFLFLVSLISYAILEHREFFTASNFSRVFFTSFNNLSLASEFAIAFTVVIAIFIALIATRHFVAGILFFIYIVWGTFMLWLFGGMPGTSVPYSTAITYWGVLLIPTIFLWLGTFSFMNSDGSLTDHEIEMISNSPPLPPPVREQDITRLSDNQEFYLGLSGIRTGTGPNVEGLQVREREQEREQKREQQ